MGVQRLNMLLKNHQEIHQEVRFRSSRLVVDGCNLLYQLYFSSGLDQNHGGEYAAFEALIEKFVQALRDCDIKPYVVLDGGTDPTDKKSETLMSRAKNRLRKANRAAEDGARENVLPQLAKLVFRQTLIWLKVPLAQCYGETDREIAALAREWECPVLSQDSDFFIFDLPAGLLPIDHFQWKAVERSGSQSSIPCKSYNTSSFCIHFNIKPQLLPAFAALAGNDYVKLPINWAQFAPEGNKTTRHLEGLLRWLRGFQTPHQAFEAALGLMGDLSETRRDKAMKDLYLGMEEYQLPPSTLKKFFIHGTPPPFPEELAGRVPDWTRLPLTQAWLNSNILYVLLLRRMSFSCAVELHTTPSAHRTSRPLRRLMYGLLLGEGKEVSENDRDGFQFKIVPVQSAVTATSEKLELDSLDKAEPSLRLQVLQEALGVTEASLRDLPPWLRLPVAVTCYWLRTAQPPPDEVLLKALLLGLCTGDPLRHRADLQIFNITLSKSYKEPTDAVVGHAINQWQSCLRTSIDLNQLLGFPFLEPPVSRLYEGTLVHQLDRRTRSRRKTRLFPIYDRCSVNRYNLMQDIVHQLHAREAPAPSEEQGATAAAAAVQQEQEQCQAPLDDVTVNLQQLFLQDDDEDEDQTVKDNSDKFSMDELDTIKQSFYVDDCLKSVPSIKQAVKPTTGLREACTQGGFTLTKWVSNSLEVLPTVPESHRAKLVKQLDLDREKPPLERVLGIQWNIHRDSFTFTVAVKSHKSSHKTSDPLHS
ncbi:protein asteroid homolog 1-like [Centropristis striata]|uniref:protein asteroid homolog 1-like n=1 Tax=Centropristis striata TaxID=184440 RepID=UPI0027DFEDED|nr:protein asteroid homolog 1-like [Centropristis striata]